MNVNSLSFLSFETHVKTCIIVETIKKKICFFFFWVCLSLTRVFLMQNVWLCMRDAWNGLENQEVRSLWTRKFYAFFCWEKRLLNIARENFCQFSYRKEKKNWTLFFRYFAICEIDLNNLNIHSSTPLQKCSTREIFPSFIRWIIQNLFVPIIRGRFSLRANVLEIVFRAR